MTAERASNRRRAVLRALGAAAASVCAPAWAVWPSRKVMLVVGQPAGGVADGIARLLAEPMARSLGQPVEVENRPGAGGTAAALRVSQAAPDALTLLLSHTVPLAAAPSALERAPYDPLDDFTHVAALGRSPFLLVAHPRTQMTTLSDLQARTRGDSLGYLTAGPGSLGHIYGELLRTSLNLKLVHLAPRGPSLTQEVASGAVPLAIGAVAPFVPHFHGGQVVPIAVTSAERCELMPDVPTMADFGHPGLVLENVYGLSAPARLPQGHLGRLGAACSQAMARPDVQAKLAALGLESMQAGAFSYTQLVRQQVGLLAPVVRAAGIRL